MRTLSALEKVEEGSYEHRDLALPRKGCAWGTHLDVLLLQQTVVLFEVRAPAPLIAQLLFSRVAQDLQAVQVLSQLLHFPVMLAVRFLSRC